jgi:hypothetical protein
MTKAAGSGAAEGGRSVTNYLENLIVRNGEKRRPRGRG